jgi:hypothetical protein
MKPNTVYDNQTLINNEYSSATMCCATGKESSISWGILLVSSDTPLHKIQFNMFIGYSIDIIINKPLFEIHK